jgi:hypothetical protein
VCVCVVIYLLGGITQRERERERVCVCVKILDGWKFTERERERDGYRVTFWRAWV